MSFRVFGRITEKESGLGIPDLIVKAIDKDFIYDDLLGASTTNADGYFDIYYEEKHFKEIFEKNPDLIILVKTPDQSTVLFSSEDSVRCEAGREEKYNIYLSKKELGSLSPTARPVYGPLRGKVLVTLMEHGKLLDKATGTALFGEHKSIGAKQHNLEFKDKASLELDLASGEYTYQISVKGYKVGRGFIEIKSGENNALDLALEKRTAKLPTLEQRLNRYGLSTKDQELKSYDIREESLVSRKAGPFKDSVRTLRATNIQDIKRWTGSFDQAIGHDKPILGKLPDLRSVPSSIFDGSLGSSTSEREVSERVLAAISREYIHGNSLAVAQFEAHINRFFPDNGLDLGIFTGNTVTIHDGAVMILGNGVNVLFADRLRIHVNGTLRIVGESRVDVGIYERFS